jgi:hypothetical protein
MLFLTGKAALAGDLTYVLNWVQGYEAGQRKGHPHLEDIVLVGHSAVVGFRSTSLVVVWLKSADWSLWPLFPILEGGFYRESMPLQY